MRFREDDRYIRGKAAQDEFALMFRRAGFHLIEADSLTAQAPGYEGKNFMVAPDFHAAEGFYLEVKQKERTSWTHTKGKRYEHGWPSSQDHAYRELQRTTGQRVIMAIKEVRAPLPPEGPGIPGKWPIYLAQYLDLLGLARLSNMAGDSYSFYARQAFSPAHVFLERLRFAHPTPQPLQGALWQ